VSALLEVRDLHKKYGEIVVADAITFELRRHECLGVIGPNGAGKSSLFNLIMGSAQPDSGSVSLEGRSILGLPTHLRVRAGVVRAFQIPQSFPHLTVYENVLAAATFGAGLRGHAASRAALAALERTGLSQKRAALAAGLSLLERKRLELAKAVGASPKVLLLDEVAGGLTEAEVEVLIALVRSLKSDYAIIWIEHIPQALRVVADRIMVLHFGRRLLDAPPDETLASSIVREIYMGLGDADAAA
jgi:branched-chain amino acid transport system ATP-binding protein